MMNYFVYTVEPGMYEILRGKVVRNKKFWGLSFVSLGVTKKSFETKLMFKTKKTKEEIMESDFFAWTNVQELHSLNGPFPYDLIDTWAYKCFDDFKYISEAEASEHDLYSPVRFKAKVFNKTGNLWMRKELVIDYKQCYTPPLNHSIRVLKRYYPIIYQNVIFPKRLGL